MNKTGEIKLNELNDHEKFILFSIGDKPREKHFGLESTIPNYLTSIGLVDYCGSGRYELTDKGRQLYLQNMIFSDGHTKETSIKEEQLITN